jgi:hypothetical protein
MKNKKEHNDYQKEAEPEYDTNHNLIIGKMTCNMCH